jgi:hypothetical protein
VQRISSQTDNTASQFHLHLHSSNEVNNATPDNHSMVASGSGVGMELILAAFIVVVA